MTDTPRVEAALSALRKELGGGHIDLNEIIVLGADLKAEQLRKERSDRAGLRRRLAERVREGNLPVDPDAAAEVRRRGWAPAGAL